MTTQVLFVYHRSPESIKIVRSLLARGYNVLIIHSNSRYIEYFENMYLEYCTFGLLPSLPIVITHGAVPSAVKTSVYIREVFPTIKMLLLDNGSSTEAEQNCFDNVLYTPTPAVKVDAEIQALL